MPSKYGFSNQDDEKQKKQKENQKKEEIDNTKNEIIKQVVDTNKSKLTDIFTDYLDTIKFELAGNDAVFGKPQFSDSHYAYTNVWFRVKVWNTKTTTLHSERTMYHPKPEYVRVLIEYIFEVQFYVRWDDKKVFFQISDVEAEAYYAIDNEKGGFEPGDRRLIRSHLLPQRAQLEKIFEKELGIKVAKGKIE